MLVNVKVSIDVTRSAGAVPVLPHVLQAAGVAVVNDVMQAADAQGLRLGHCDYEVRLVNVDQTD